jgi:glycosyltransferase involved in cell wall biosynthesis
MRILLDGRALQPELDGIGRFTAAVAGRLSLIRPGWDMTLLVSEGSTHHLAGSGALHLEGSRVPRFLPGEKRRLSSTVSRISPQAWCCFSMAGPSWEGIPSCFMIHDLMVLELPRYFGPSCLRNALYRKWFGHIIRRSALAAAAIVVPSRWVSDRVRARFPEAARKIRVIYEGQDLFDPQATPLPRAGDFLLYVGNARAYKNLPGLLRAFSLASSRKALPKLVMVIRRDRAYAAVVKAVARLGLESRVEILSAVSEDKLRSLYSGCMALLSPSISEGFGLPVVEAMAAGCPVLASKGTTLEEVAGDGALLVDPGSTEAMAAGILELASDATMRQELSMKAHARASLFSWDSTAHSFATLLEEIAR